MSDSWFLCPANVVLRGLEEASAYSFAQYRSSGHKKKVSVLGEWKENGVLQQIWNCSRYLFYVCTNSSVDSLIEVNEDLLNVCLGLHGSSIYIRLYKVMIFIGFRPFAGCFRVLYIFPFLTFPYICLVTWFHVVVLIVLNVFVCALLIW